MLGLEEMTIIQTSLVYFGKIFTAFLIFAESLSNYQFQLC